MKFGQQIKKSTYADWRYYYLDYDAVKKLLKSGNGIDGVFNESDELAFVERLEVELEY